MSLPYATPDFAGIGGSIKQHNEDFIVHEIPLYEPSGAGEHVYCEIQKEGMTTFDVVSQLSRALGVPGLDVGFAGMKDAHAITRQGFSIKGTTESAVQGLRIPGMQVLSTARHVNKLRLGHLKGNRFEIKIRDVEPTAVTQIAPVLKAMETRGVPNFFGEQRFGRRNNNDLLGAALIRGDNKELAHLLLGDPRKNVDDGMVYKARRLYDENDLKGSMDAWPRRCGLERRLLARVIKTGKASGAGRAIDDKLRRLFVSALQSRVFNEILAQRLATYDQLIDGDWAYKHDNGACFHVEDLAAEQARAAAWEISPTGPLIGFRVSLADKAAGEIETAVLAEHKLTPEMFKVPGHHRVKGARRPLRVRAEDMQHSAGVDANGGYVALSFMLPPGAFATILLREVMKTDDDTLGEAAGGESAGNDEAPESASGHPLGATESVDDDEGEN